MTNERLRNDEIMNLREVAAYLRCSPRTIQKQMHEGRIPYAKIGRKVIFRKSLVDAAIFGPEVDSKRSNL